MNTTGASGSSAAYPQISLAVQAPSPSTSPNICSYDCAIAWLTNRKAIDIQNKVALTIPKTTKTIITVSPSAATPGVTTSVVNLNSTMAVT